MSYVLRAPHRIPAVMAQITIPITHRNRPAVVAARCVRLEPGELIAAAFGGGDWRLGAGGWGLGLERDAGDQDAVGW